MTRIAMLVSLHAMLSPACSNGHDASEADAGPDQASDARQPDSGVPVECTGAPSEATWRRTWLPVVGVELLETSEVTVGRSARFRIDYQSCPGDQLGAWSYGFTLENEFVVIDALAWRAGPDCAEPTVASRDFVIRLPYAATWRFGDLLEVQVGPDPASECLCIPDAPCVADCDCEGTQVCLSDSSGEQRCVLPCQANRDCQGQGVCGDDATMTDICLFGVPECDSDTPCPCGFACDGQTCQPAFTLNQSTRHECDADADCDQPLRCVETQWGEGDLRKTCEAICQTNSDGWCQGPHTCNPAASVETNSQGVCSWVGD